MDARALKTWVILVTAALFGGWELLKHAFMMELPMAEFHLVSLAVEGAIAVAIALGALAAIAAYQEQVERADELARTVGQAVGTSAVVETALADIQQNAQVLQERLLPGDEVARRASHIIQEAKQIRKVVGTLAALPAITDANKHWV